MHDLTVSNYFHIEDVYDMPDLMDGSHQESLHRDAAIALTRCINTHGCVNLPWMAETSGLSAGELIDALKGAIFQDPEHYDLHQSETEGWYLRPQYISGNLKLKLEAARVLNRKYSGRFNVNLLALKQVLPKRVPFENIGISIESPWIPAHFYAEFAQDVLGLFRTPGISHSAKLGLWKVKVPPDAASDSRNTVTFGTERMPAAKILEHTLNKSTVKVYDQVYRPDRKSGVASILNKNETIAAQEKQEALQKAFPNWVVKDPQRIRQLEEIYYNTFTCVVPGRYDGSFLTLSDLNPDFEPYPHQKNAVARIVLEQDVLLNHKVGSGKTNVIIMGLHERKRMGLSEKNLVVVPNNVLEAFERAHRYLYPNDRILVIRPEKEFKPANRQKTLERIRDEDFVAVYMAYSSFDMIPMSRQYRLDQKVEEIRSLRSAANASTDYWEKSQLNQLADRMSKELTKIRQELPPDKYPPFDTLGITTLALDEAHNYKNVTVRTRSDGVVGMHAAGSRKCDAMLEKTRFVRRNGGGLVFSTGTPLTNSISDLFVLQHFLQPEQLELLHLNHFDEWIGSFATRQTGFEVDVDSQNFRITTRFSRFHNLPELTSLFANVCDFYNGTDSGIGLPIFNGYIDTVVPRSREQEEYIDELVYRTELVREKLVKSHEDNLLKITHDGRAAALDIRLVEPGKNPDPTGTKVYACAKNVYDCWQKYSGTSQLVFSDLGTPKKGFNVYDELKTRLMEMGIPEKEIAFVHDADTDAKRRKLFAAVNDASIRVLIGSTSKLGTGVNVQERLIAIHHLDIPWKPSDIIQREGRGRRQGNRNPEIFIFRYITEGTFDAYSWQTEENKLRFIGQFMGGALADRDAQDIDASLLSCAEIKALCVGDSLLKTRFETANQLERAKLHSLRRDQELRQMQQIVADSPGMLVTLKQRRERLLEDQAHFIRNREPISRQERRSFGEVLLESLADSHVSGHDRLFDTLHGFQVLLPANIQPDHPRILIQGVTSNRYEVDMQDARASGCIQRIEHLLLHLGDRINRVAEACARVQAELEHARAELLLGNSYVHEVNVLKNRLLDIDVELNRRAEVCAI